MSLIESTTDIVVAHINANPGISDGAVIENMRKFYKALSSLESGIEEQEPEPVQQFIRVDERGNRVFPPAETRRPARRNKKCLECGQYFVSITHFHTKGKHGMSLTEYMKKHKTA